MRTQHRLMCLCVLLVCSAFGSGCAPKTYLFTRFRPADAPPPPFQIEHGEPIPVIDGIGKVVGFPARVLTLNKNVNKHEISPETIEELKLYMERNDLTDVVVAVKQYAPREQWRRLRENSRISPGWKYTFGTLGWVQYTLFPTRIFGGDTYDPYANTLSISSDHPSALIAEAAVAKQIREMRYPGPYAAITGLPGFSLIRYTRATSDVLGYARAQGSWENEKKAYRLLYPQLGIQATAAPGLFLDFFPGIGVTAGGAAVGHGAAWYAVRRREREIAASKSSSEAGVETFADADAGSNTTTPLESERKSVQPASAQASTTRSPSGSPVQRAFEASAADSVE